MEWEKQPPPQQQQVEDPGGSGGGGMFVKVMTDEQMEVLRKQIAVYAIICEKLVALHKSLTSQHDLAGARLGNLYIDPLITSGAHKITGRQRWTPTPNQLQILERIFDQGVGTPSKQKIREITTDLSQHGQISETNVYNWFQNRRARSKRKQQATPPNNAESEPDTEVESPNDKKKQHPPDDQFQQFHPTSTTKPEPPPILQPPDQGTSDYAANFPHMSYYGTSILSNQGMEQFMGKLEVSRNYNQYLQQDDYNMDR